MGRFDEDERNTNIEENDKIERWNEIHGKIGSRQQIKNQYDGWLDERSIC